MYSEGKAKIKYHGAAFLNPSAKFLRDLSVAFIAQSAKRSTRILDPTGATGIRGIRFYLETKSRSITIIDINKKAANMAARNAKFNGVRAKVLHTSIQEFSSAKRDKFSVIDLDPFGGCTPYINDLMRISKNGTCLLATATDTAVLCGAHEKACVKIYDAKPMHNELCHEVGIRILLGYIARVAAQFNYGIKVIMALSYLHYMKVFVKLEYGAEKSMNSVNNLGYAFYCNACGARSIEKGMFPRNAACGFCKARLAIAGKLWAGPIKDQVSIKQMLDFFIENKMDKNEIKVLDMLYNEPEVPLYYSIPRATSRLRLQSVSPSSVVERLRQMGFLAARTHFDDSSVKTNATIRDINTVLAPKK